MKREKKDRQRGAGRGWRGGSSQGSGGEGGGGPRQGEAGPGKLASNYSNSA